MALEELDDTEEENLIAPDIIDQYGPSYLDLDYDSAVQELQTTYETTSWTDPEVAAQKTAQLMDDLRQYHEIEPEPVKLDTNATELTNVLLDESLDDSAKISAIEDWRTDAKERLYNDVAAEDLPSARLKEQIIDSYAMELRRDTVAGDVGFWKDSLVRGMEAAIAPLVGTADLVLDTEMKKELNQFALDNTNPNKDKDFLAGVASGIGSVTGFAVSAVNPYTAVGYLGATLTSEAKDVYDTALEQTGNNDAALQALYESSPGIAFQVLADRMVGKSVASVFKGTAKGVGVIGAAAGEAVAETTNLINQGQALARATGDSRFIPTTDDIIRTALVSGTVGGIGGGFSDAVDLYKRRQNPAVNQLQTEIKKTLNVESVPGEINKESSFAQFIEQPEENVVQSSSNDTEESVLASVNEQGGPITPNLKKLASELVPDDSTDGETVLEQNTQQNNSYDKLLPAMPVGSPTQPYMLSLARDLDASLTVKNTQHWGFYSPTHNAIVYNRHLFKDINQAYSTIAHEIGHAVDYAGRNEDVKAGLKLRPPRTEPVVNKLVRLNNALRTALEKASGDVVKQQAREVSAAWRPGWEGAPKTQQEALPTSYAFRDPKYLNYRNNTTEIQADVFSALVNDPEFVRQQAPELYDAFITGLETQPIVKDFWEQHNELRDNPDAFFRWAMEQNEQGRVKQAKISKQSFEESILEKSQQARDEFKKLPRELRKLFVRREAVAKDILESFEPGTRERQQAAELFNELRADKVSAQETRAKLDLPLKTLMDNVGQTDWGDFDKNTVFKFWGDYEKYNRIVNERTLVMESILNNQEAYKDAYTRMRDLLIREYRLQESRIDEVDDLAGDDLLDAFARFNKLIHTQTRIVNELAQSLIDDGNLLALDLLKDSSFRARRYLANPDSDFNSAKAGLDFIGRELGETNYRQLQEFSEQYHEILNSALIPMLRESQIVSSDVIDMMTLNKDNYVTFNALKYFSDDPRIPASVRTQYGNLEKIGDELVSTAMKAKAMMTWANFQSSRNAAVELARMGDYTVTEIPQDLFFYSTKKGTKVRAKSLYELRDELSRKNPENSYLIQYEEGTPHLFEIDSKDFADIFKSSGLMESSATRPLMRFLDAYHKMFAERELKTTLNPWFVIRSKFRDRAQEAILAGSLKSIPGLPFHTDPRLAEMLKRVTPEAENFLKGEYGPIAETLLEQHALPYQIVADVGGFIDPTFSAENAIYEAAGRPVPDETKIRFPDRWNKTLNTTINKYTGGLIRHTAEVDEVRTKMMAFLIGKEIKGLSDAEAAIMANELAGTPDPLGGGSEAVGVNKLFLFGRAHINGMRGLYNVFKSDPRSFAAQYGMRVMMPRMLASSAIAAPLIGAFFGEDEEKKYRKFLDKIPTYEKISKINIPLGFVDDRGEFRGFSMASDEINADWKALTVALPMAHELVTASNIMHPSFKALENLIATGGIDARQIAKDVAESIKTVFGGNVSPALLGTYRTGQVLMGENPYDFYRKRGIVDPDTYKAGSMLRTFYEYMLWSSARTVPSMFNYSTDKKSAGDVPTPYDDIVKIFGVGPGVRSFVRQTNYGDFEKYVELQAEKEKIDATIRQDTGVKTRELREGYLKANRLYRRLGKEGLRELSRDRQRDIIMLQRWNTRAYRHAIHEMRAAREIGDMERYNKIKDALERQSERYLKFLNK